MSARLPPPVVALTPGDARPGIERAVGAAFEAGLRGVVLRESALGDREYLELATRLRAILALESGGWLALHDRPHLARAAQADAVHLGGSSLPPDTVRAWLDPRIAIGLSTHAEDDAATWGAAEYLFHGPVLATTKPGARPAVGLEGLRRAVARSPRPIWALGGLAPEHAPQLAACGARGMAVLSGILPTNAVAVRARAYVAAWPA